MARCGAMYPTIRFSPTSQGCSTLRSSPRSGRNNPFATRRSEHEDEEDVHEVQMKLAVLEHQQSATDGKVLELENAMRVLRASADPSGGFSQQLKELKRELSAAAEEDAAHREELAKELRAELVEAKKQLRKELVASLKGGREEDEKSFLSVPEMEDEQPEVLAETRGEVHELASQLRAELAPFRAETAHSFELCAAPLREEVRLLQHHVRQLQHDAAELRRQQTQPSEVQQLNEAFHKTINFFSEELDSRSSQLHKAFELRLGAKDEDWAEQSRSLQQANSAALRKEYTVLLHAETTSLREDLLGSTQALRAEVQSGQAQLLRDCREAQKGTEVDVKELKAAFGAATARSAEDSARQAKLLSEVGRYRDETAKLTGLVTKLQELPRPADGERPVGDSEVRRLINETLASPAAKAQRRESCDEALQPVHVRIDGVISEVARLKNAVAEESKSARKELGGLLRAEIAEVAGAAASKTRRNLDAEVRSAAETLRRQLFEALETSTLRSTQQLKEFTASHSSEVRVVGDKVDEMQRFAHELSFSVSELKGTTKALENGVELRRPAANAVDEMLLRRLEEELSGHMRLSSAKVRELQDAASHLQERAGDHTRQLQRLAGEAVASNQRLETFAMLLETANERLDQFDGRFLRLEERLGNVEVRAADKEAQDNAGERFRGLEARFASLAEAANQRLDRVDSRVGHFEEVTTSRLNLMEGRFAHVEDRLDGVDSRLDAVEAQAAMPSRIAEAEDEASTHRDREPDSPQWSVAVRGMENLTQIVGSLERSEGSVEQIGAVAVRQEVQSELEQVWTALHELESRMITRPGAGLEERTGPQSSRAKAEEDDVTLPPEKLEAQRRPAAEVVVQDVTVSSPKERLAREQSMSHRTFASAKSEHSESDGEDESYTEESEEEDKTMIQELSKESERR